MDVTIIIPTYNRYDALRITLEALVQVDYPVNQWEAIIIDDGSTDETAEAVPAWIKEHNAPIRYLRQSNAGPAAARNRGARVAQGNTLIFIDNDIIVPQNFIRMHLQTLAVHPGSWILGRITHPPQLRNTPFGRFRNSLWEAFHTAHATDQIVLTEGMSAANIALPAADFYQLGGYDEDFTIASSEDWDLGVRARQMGIRVLYHSGIVVLHNDWAGTLKQFCRRQMMYSISDVLLWRKYGGASLRSQLVLENAPINWKEDQAKLILKKTLKQVIATRIGQQAIQVLCGLAERLFPDTSVSQRAYELAIAIAIFKGVREGYQRYISNTPVGYSNKTRGSLQSLSGQVNQEGPNKL